MKTYKLSFQDRKQNELTTQIITANNIKEARQFAAKKMAESKINELYKIKVTLN